MAEQFYKKEDEEAGPGKVHSLEPEINVASEPGKEPGWAVLRFLVYCFCLAWQALYLFLWLTVPSHVGPTALFIACAGVTLALLPRVRQSPRYSLLAGACSLLATMVLLPQFVRPHRGGQLTGCKSMLKSVGTSLEMYSTDNDGRYPTTLDKLTPNYLKTIPRCPSAESETYSQSYQWAVLPDSYTISCAGHHHKVAGLEVNFPQFTATDGLLIRPVTPGRPQPLR